MTVLPRLMDCKAIMDELGVTRYTAEAFMRPLPKVKVPDVRKTFVKRTDLERLLREAEKAA